ncbi:MAG: peptidase domain-containing ABC transporter [Treponema sp.]|nr:peptidase domain-containing ABC transporter [Treponema sp.]
MITKNTFKRIINLISVYKKEIILTITLTLLISLVGIIDSLLLSYLIDNVLYSNAKITLFTISIIMILLAIFQISLKGLKNLLIQKISYKMDIDFIKKFYDKVLKIHYPFFEKHKNGELTSRLNDTRMAREAFSEGFISIIADIIMFFVIGFTLFELNSALFLIQLLSVAILCIIVIVFGKFFDKEYPISMEKYADFQSFITESFAGIEVIKTTPSIKSFNNRFDNQQIQYIKQSWKIDEHTIMQNSFCSAIEKLTFVFLLITGSLFVMKERMSLGQVASFLALSGFFTTSVGNLLDLQAGIQEAFAAIKRLFDILDEDVEVIKTKKRISNYVPQIIFKDVSFSYKKDHILYNNFNITISPGEWISFVGKTGCGKTTFIKLLLKLYHPQNGVIYWNNEDIQKLNTNSIRSRIAYISQDVFLFSGTIIDNITMFDESIPAEIVIETIKKVGLYEKISNLENGLYTIIGERGFSLSGGEKQKIAICRALIKDPLLIIMDEATSNLDSNSEKEILKIILQQKSEGKSIISIAHRLTTVEQSDKIYVLDSGKIVEEGNFKYLKNANGVFSKMLHNEQTYKKQPVSVERELGK